MKAPESGTARRVLLIGWDAADWRMIRPLMQQGYMPSLAGMMKRGTSGNLATLTPIFSPMLWSSIATGKRPFKHGVHGFTEVAPDGKTVRSISGYSRKTHAIWNMLNLAGKTSNVIGWWPSHPADPIRGAMVSNHFQRAPKGTSDTWPMMEGSVHPDRLAPVLEDLRLHPSELSAEELQLFVPTGHEIDQEHDRRLDSLMRILADCTTIQSAATHLIEHEPWDFTAVYFDAIDHFGHGFMQYHPPQQPSVSDMDFRLYQQVMSAGYIYHDLMLGRLLELAGEDATVILISDHGFHPDHLRPLERPMEPAGPAIEHRDQGIFAAAGPGIKHGTMLTGATLLDIAPTILTLFGLPCGDDMDGHPLVNALDDCVVPDTIPSWDDVEGDAGRLTEEQSLSDSAQADLLEHLIALGYIDRPDENSEKAVADTLAEQRFNLALSYIDAGRHPQAAELLEALYADHPLEFRYGVQLAFCLQAMQQPEAMAQVVDHLQQTWAHASELATARIHTFIAERSGVQTDSEGQETKVHLKPQEAQVMRRLHALVRGNPGAFAVLSSAVAAARGDAQASLDHLADGLEQQSPQIHTQAGYSLLTLLRNEDAADRFEAALEIEPEHAPAHLGLARVALRQKRFKQAEGHARAAAALQDRMAPAHFFLGIALHREGKTLDGIKSLERAIALNPNFPQAHIMLARIHRLLGDRVRFTQHLNEVKALRIIQAEVTSNSAAPKLVTLSKDVIAAELPDWPEPSQRLLPLAAPKSEKAVKKQVGKVPVYVVSGLPRSGTSMAMQMLVAGGVVHENSGAIIGHVGARDWPGRAA